MKNLKELSEKELNLISGGGFFKDLGAGLHQLFCDCGKKKVSWGNGSSRDFYNSGMPKY